MFEFLMLKHNTDDYIMRGTSPHIPRLVEKIKIQNVPKGLVVKDIIYNYVEGVFGNQSVTIYIEIE